MKRWIRDIFKCLAVWGMIISLSSISFAETKYKLLNIRPSKGSNHQILKFLKEFNEAKVVRDLIPLVDRYLEKSKNKTFLKNHLKQFMALEAPQVQLQGDLITLTFVSQKKTLKMRLNRNNSKLYVKGKIINLEGMNSQTLTSKLSQLNLVSYNSSFSIINEAHAALGLALLAVAGIAALIVGALGLLSSWSRKSCFSKFEDLFRGFETAELNCLNDKASVLVSPGSKKLTDTYQYIQSIKEQMKQQKSSHKACQNEVSEHFKYFSFWRKKPCLSKEPVGLMCDKMQQLEVCLQEYEDLNVEAISEERLKIKIHQFNEGKKRKKSDRGQMGKNQ